MNPTVIKRDGSREKFDMHKIERIMAAAGLTSQQTARVAVHIKQWLKGLEKNVVSSSEIRDRLLTILPEIDSHSADLFVWYQNTKDKKS